MFKDIFVVNMQGVREPFSSDKVYFSAQRAGASKPAAREIATVIEKEVYNGMRTEEIFRRVKELLERGDRKASMRFSLKEAMRRLGPAGYTFEKYVGEIFEDLGYNVKLNQMVMGQCVSYEIDFLAEKDNFVYIGECKFHKLPEGKVDLQVALANCARFHDIRDRGSFGDKEIKSILVTNTKFTTEAVKYSECSHIDLLGWRHPAEQGLEYIVESRNLYPLTILPSCKGRLAEIFVARKKLLVKDILEAAEQGNRFEPEMVRHGFNSAVREAEILMKR